MLDEIARLLVGTAVPGTFATRRVADAGDLHLDVKGIGPVPIPVPATVARRLCDVARPARYGLRDQTLLDERVRAGWEIGKRQIKIDARRWRRTLDRQLEQVGRDLGLPDGCRLRAELYNLLVYGPGQFFAPHQDSEKADGMIGTLVVVHQIVERHELAVSHQTRRVGRPYTLVLTKTPALFARVASERKTWASDLAWLRRVARSFASRSSSPVGAVPGGRNAQMEAP